MSHDPRGLGSLGFVALALALGASGCGDDDDDGPAPDAGPDDAGPWESGELTCAHDPMSDYATRTYTFADPFDRQDLGPNWHTSAGAAWSIQGESRLVVTGAGDGPGPLAMVGDRQTGTDIVGWFDVDHAGGWAGAPAVACRADGPPMSMGYGLRVHADDLELFEQDGAGVADAVARADLAAPLADDARVRLVIGCTGDTVTGFVYALDAAGNAGERLGCASWRSGDSVRVGAFALTQQDGTTGFDNARMTLDP